MLFKASSLKSSVDLLYFFFPGVFCFFMSSPSDLLLWRLQDSLFLSSKSKIFLYDWLWLYFWSRKHTRGVNLGPIKASSNGWESKRRRMNRLNLPQFGVFVFTWDGHKHSQIPQILHRISSVVSEIIDDGWPAATSPTSPNSWIINEKVRRAAARSTKHSNNSSLILMCCIVSAPAAMLFYYLH